MTNASERPRATAFNTSILPWLLGGGMFLVFLLTLEHWITPNPASPISLEQFTDLAGWRREQHIFGQVAFLVTYPIRWLPLGLMPIALNLFSAVCASLALVQLGRSVAILPQDRTHAQRQRESSEFSFLTVPAAWVPIVFAVLLCGLQMTFWEHAISASGEMFDLLIFSYVIRCLLEYRISQKECWLTQFALIYGLGMADDWAMIGFFPLFLVALVWIKGASFFNLGFLFKTFGLGLLGLSLFLLYPVMNNFTHLVHQKTGEMILSFIMAEKNVMRIYYYRRELVLLLSLTSILPIFVMGIRWSSYFGDNSALGILLARSIFHIVYGLFLLACVWVALDATVSPRSTGLGLPFLTFYYLGALTIGYCTGYFLLVFGGRMTRYQRKLSPMVQLSKTIVTVLLWVIVIGAPLIMIRKNVTAIMDEKIVSNTYERYFTQLEQLLPEKGAVVMSDDSYRLFYLQAELAKQSKKSPHLLIDTTQLINDPNYVPYLNARNPEFSLTALKTNSDGAPDALAVIHLLDTLSASHDLYYLHSSFGYFFEHFYDEPQGLLYRLKPYPTNVWDAPTVTKDQISYNEDFWKKSFTDVLPPLTNIMAKPQFPANPTLWDKFVTKAHLRIERDWAVIPLAGYYAHALNYWGVEMQKVKMLDEAGVRFAQAVQLDPLNLSVRVNEAFNQNLRTHNWKALQVPREIQERFSQPGVWNEILNVDGPIDEPNFRFNLAATLVKAGECRQAVQQLHRIHEISPNSPKVAPQLAELLAYIQSRPNELTVFLPDEPTRYSDIVTNTDLALKVTPDDPYMLFLKGVALIQLKDYQKALEPLNHLLTLDPTNYAAMLNRAIANYKLGNLETAKPDYEAVGKASPKTFQVYFGLAEIAFKQNDIPTAIKNYELYLTNAPANSEEAVTVATRLKELETQGH